MPKKRKRGGAGTDREPEARPTVRREARVDPSRVPGAAPGTDPNALLPPENQDLRGHLPRVGPNVDPRLALPTVHGHPSTGEPRFRGRTIPSSGAADPVLPPPSTGHPSTGEPVREYIPVFRGGGPTASAAGQLIVLDEAGKLPKIEPGTVVPVATAERVPVERQPIRTIPGGMRVTTDPQTGVIQRDPRDPSLNPEQMVPTTTARDRLRALLRRSLMLEN